MFTSRYNYFYFSKVSEYFLTQHLESHTQTVKIQKTVVIER